MCFHGDMPIPARKTAIERFTGVLGAESSASNGVENGNEGITDLPRILMEDGSSIGEQPVLVCTDLAARGLDMPARVHHVINFDFPVNAKDYLHRSGRTARAGATGTITSLLQTALERTLAGRIEHGLKSNEAIDELTSMSVGGRRTDEFGRAGRGRDAGGRRGGDMSSRVKGAGRGGGGRGGRSTSSSRRGTVLPSDKPKGSKHQRAPKFTEGPGKGRAGSSSSSGGTGWGRSAGGRESSAARDVGGRGRVGRDSARGRGGRSGARMGSSGRGSGGRQQFDRDGVPQGGRRGQSAGRTGGRGRGGGARSRSVGRSPRGGGQSMR